MSSPASAWQTCVSSPTVTHSSVMFPCLPLSGHPSSRVMPGIRPPWTLPPWRLCLSTAGRRPICVVWDTVKTCNLCQLNKVIKHHHSPVIEMPVPMEPFSHIHVDLVGPFHPSHGFTHLFPIIDRSTHWPEAIPVSNTAAEMCADVLLNWVARFSMPRHLTSDRGAQFTSALLDRIASMLGILPPGTSSSPRLSLASIRRSVKTLAVQPQIWSSSTYLCYPGSCSVLRHLPPLSSP